MVMIKTFKEIQFETLEFTSDSNFSPKFLYDQILPASKQVNLLLGFFNSSAFNALSKSFSEFISNGGTMRIVTNTEIDKKDFKELFEDGNNSPDNIEYIKRIITSPTELEKEFQGYGQYFYDCLRYLKDSGRLELRSTVYSRDYKSFHESHSKRIIFFDGNDYVMANGSANFTKTGIELNAEDVTIILGWSDSDPNRIKEQLKRFERIFNGENPKYLLLPNEVLEEIIDTRGKKLDKYKLIDNRKSLLRELVSKNPNLKYLSEDEELEPVNEINIISDYRGPKQKFDPRPYQKEAFDSWISNNKIGLFTMATGTGKTFTAINCIINEYYNNGPTKNIVVAWGEELVNQWYEALVDANFRNIFKWSSKNTRLPEHKRRIRDLRRGKDLNIIITYHSFIRDFEQFVGNDLSGYNVIFDEAHHMAGPSFMTKIQEFHFNNRIGLSATPLKDWDEEGSNDFILDFFKSQEKGTIFDYSMRDAINNGNLSKYDYHPYFINLEDDEWEKYKEYSASIMRTTEIGGINKHSAMQRQLVVDQASQKIAMVIKILNDIKKKGEIKYTLLYSPKGEDDDNSDDLKLIEKIAKQVSLNFQGLVHHIFLGETEDRELLLEEFEKGDVHLLHAIKCLDEGVDVPKTRNAIFVASGKNKREYIQRRGRVLRKDGDKVAQIYDIIAVPSESQFYLKKNIATSFLKNEFKRVEEFLELSREETRALAINKINNLLVNYGYNYTSLIEENKD